MKEIVSCCNVCDDLKRYKFIETIGIGETLHVYIAERKDSSRVVVKVLRKDDSSENRYKRKRFKREVDILRLIHHPNIVKILEHGDHDGFPTLSWTISAE